MFPRLWELRAPVALLVGLASACAPLQAEEPKAKPPAAAEPDWNAIFQIHYTQRVQEFRAQNQIFWNVVLVGDSITEGFDIAKWFPNRRILNRGIGADVLGNDLPEADKRGVLKRLDESFFDVSAREAFVLIGINDLGAGHSPDQVETGYRQMLKRVKESAPTLRVHVQSVLPTRGDHAKHNANVRDVNQRLRKLAQEFAYPYLDLHSLMTDEQGELRNELTADGLHINAEGYRIWKGQIDQAMGWNDVGE